MRASSPVKGVAFLRAINVRGHVVKMEKLRALFEKAGILNVEGRWVTLADRDRLKDAACECYDVMRRNYARVGK